MTTIGGTNSILLTQCDNASDATWWPSLLQLQVLPIFNSCWWQYLVAKIATDTSSATWWQNLQPIQVVAQLTHAIESKT